MKSLEHVFWRGALALGFLAVGIGSGIGMPPATTGDLAERADCPSRPLVQVMLRGQAGLPVGVIASSFVGKREVAPANPES